MVCKNYSPPIGFDPSLLTPYLNPKYQDFDHLTGVNRFIVPFLVCGDVSAYDADQTFPLEVIFN